MKIGIVILSSFVNVLLAAANNTNVVFLNHTETWTQPQQATKKTTPINVDTNTKEMLKLGLLDGTLKIDKCIYSQNSLDPNFDHNVIISPISIAAATSLLLLAAAGDTKTELGILFGIDGNTFVNSIEKNENLFRMLGLLLDKFQANASNALGTTQVNLAKAIFVQEGYNITSNYKTVVKELLKSELITVDFMNNGYITQQKINHWVSSQTRGKINDIMPGAPTPDTKTVIVSALYFSGEWETPFFVNYTRVKPFFAGQSAPGRKLNRQSKDNIYVPMMVGSSEVLYHKNDELGFKAIGLPYKGRKVYMYYVLPNSQITLREIIDKMNGNALRNISRNTVSSEFIYFVPKMTLKSFTNLSPVMQKLGVHKVFDPSKADLSNLANDPGAHVDDVLHKVEIVVDEIGTVASAATVVTISRGGQPTFNVNKPFLFFIHHIDSDTIILWGTVYKPIPHTTTPPPSS
ncbi:serine protease inhibitor 42Dd-like [Adelges cooleyi]|uniref:serine protease inhibitor 42Dd-like n=1 Tax=Adelges cooleyi TaxID=133065 RepID=UPI00217F50D4|nr:serine protease inhibitor 42Dd-like [Adelges cooleyi]